MKYLSAFQVCVLSGLRYLLIGWWQNRGSLVIAAGPDVSHSITWHGLTAFLGLELKENWGLDDICNLTKTLSQQTQASSSKIVWCGSETYCPECLMLKRVVMQALLWESCEAIFWPFCSFSKGVHHITNMPGEERSGKHLNHMISNLTGQGD